MAASASHLDAYRVPRDRARTRARCRYEGILKNARISHGDTEDTEIWDTKFLRSPRHTDLIGSTPAFWRSPQRGSRAGVPSAGRLVRRVAPRRTDPALCLRLSVAVFRCAGSPLNADRQNVAGKTNNHELASRSILPAKCSSCASCPS